MNRTLTVTWRAFGDRPALGYEPEVSRTVTIDTDLTDLALCEKVYRDTNLYEGQIWDALQPLPDNRSHTAISTVFGRGDYVTIDGATYEVASMGFRKVES